MRRKNLEKYVGTFFIHTAKAIRKAGSPAYRLFCVAEVNDDDEGRFLCAWKVDRESIDTFWHPVYKDIAVSELSKYNLCLSEAEGRNLTGSTPTATFIPDSFYQQVTLEEAIERLVPVPE